MKKTRDLPEILYKGKKVYIVGETCDHYFVSKHKSGIKKFTIRKEK